MKVQKIVKKTPVQFLVNDKDISIRASLTTPKASIKPPTVFSAKTPLSKNIGSVMKSVSYISPVRKTIERKNQRIPVSRNVLGTSKSFTTAPHHLTKTVAS